MLADGPKDSDQGSSEDFVSQSWRRYNIPEESQVKAAGLEVKSKLQVANKDGRSASEQTFPTRSTVIKQPTTVPNERTKEAVVDLGSGRRE